MATTELLEKQPKKIIDPKRDSSRFDKHYEESCDFLEQRGWKRSGLNENGDTLWADPGPEYPPNTRWHIHTADGRTDNPDFPTEKAARDWAEKNNRQTVGCQPMQGVVLPGKEGTTVTQHQLVVRSLCWDYPMKEALQLEKDRDKGKEELELRERRRKEYVEQMAKEQERRRMRRP